LKNPITSTTILPARRKEITFRTRDGLSLVGEISAPEAESRASAIFFHPLPTAGGFMDSHLIRKASWRLPALANISVFRFNFRGVSSPRGASEGVFGEAVEERFDLEAALDEAERQGLTNLWLIGWSFGTEVILKHATSHIDRFRGAILLSPPLHRTSPKELERWKQVPNEVTAFIPELDDFLPPQAAREAFSTVAHFELIEAKNSKHLWVGEKQTSFILNEITKRLNPAAYPLPEVWPS